MTNPTKGKRACTRPWADPVLHRGRRRQTQSHRNAALRRMFRLFRSVPWRMAYKAEEFSGGLIQTDPSDTHWLER